jgi:cysteine desulfurase/selenocysteine lyase
MTRMITDDDLNGIRADTPGCEHVTHFNNAGASLMPRPIVDTMIRYLHLEEQIGGYEAESACHAEIEAVYSSAAHLVGAHADEIAIVENATRAWDMAFYSIPFKSGDRILTGKAAYGSDYIAFLQTVQTKGVRIDVVPDDEYGQISVSALGNMLDKSVKLIALTHIPTNGGLVNPAAQVGKLARQAKVLYMLDACQSAGQIPLDVDEIGCDILSATSRKYLRGPRGMGFLYVRREHIAELMPPFLDLHAATWVEQDRYEIRSDARRFENWECNYAAKLGMGQAIDYALSWGIAPIRERVQMLADQLRNQLELLPGIRVCDKGQEKCGIVTFMSAHRSAGYLKSIFQQNHINVTTTTRFGTRLDMEERGLDELVRASLHYFNTTAEINYFCDVLSDIIKSSIEVKN